LRLARVLTRLNLGGPARQVLASDPRLAARGWRIRVYAGSPGPGEGDLSGELCARGIEVVRVPGLRRAATPLGDLRALAFLRRELARYDPDVVHTHASKAGALGRAAAPRRAARVHTFHGHVLEGYFPPPVSRALVALERRAARRTDRVLAVSHATAEDLLRLGVAREEQLVVVPPGIELGPLLEQRGRSGVVRGPAGAGAEALVVGVLGRLAPVKRPELALDVFERLAERHPRLHLAFVGDGTERRALERRLRALPAALASRAHLLGAVADTAAVLADLDALLLTSRAEGLPVALIEAAAAGLPVVATPVGGVPELVAHERTGFLGADADELAFGLDRLLLDPGLRAAMGGRARLRVEHRHSGEALARRLADVYEAVLDERRCAS
jgi:glycosyltransferase involved in cell wall biosynthesis